MNQLTKGLISAFYDDDGELYSSVVDIIMDKQLNNELKIAKLIDVYSEDNLLMEIAHVTVEWDELIQTVQKKQEEKQMEYSLRKEELEKAYTTGFMAKQGEEGTEQAHKEFNLWWKEQEMEVAQIEAERQARLNFGEKQWYPNSR